MFKKILLGLVVIIAVICGITSFQSDKMNVSRSAIISAPPEAVFKVANDFRQWDAWSPWSKLDPNMKKILEGPAEGVGAIYRWSGNCEYQARVHSSLRWLERCAVHLSPRGGWNESHLVHAEQECLHGESHRFVRRLREDVW